MSILKYKYKAHKFINYAFYVIVFLIGFGIGFCAKEINFNKLISQVLMIDNVSAYTITTINGIEVNEEYIYNMFSSQDSENFNLENYPMIYCSYIPNSTTTRVSCNAHPKLVFESSYYVKTNSSNGFRFGLNSSNNTLRSFQFNIKPDGTIVWNSIGVIKNASTLFFDLVHNTSSTGTKMYTNFLPSSINGTPNTYDGYYNQLDFNINLEFNENLFKDNSDFKEVCVNNYDTFSITSNEVQDYDDNNSPMYHSFDFMWFPNGMKGISTWGYDSEEHDHVYIFEESENTFSGWWYWLNTKEEIDLYFGRDNPGLYLETKGYTDKYSYYNYTLYPFEMTFTETYHRYQVFWFKDPYIEYLDGTKKDDSEKYCFYIKNEYDVNILNKNQNGDFESSITILGGINRDDVTYENELNNNSNGFFSTINNFISKIRPTVIFINTHILELYTSMPLIVRSFILSFLTLIVIRILIGMVVR